MDYYQIGQRIRKIRKAHKLSQDELASKVGISTTHMSHIETGNTKLSLPVLVDLADALQVRVDDLLFDSPRDSVSSTGDELQQLLDGCNPFTVIPIILCNSCLVLSARLTRHALTRCQLRARSVLILFIIIIYYIYNIIFKESNKKTRKIQKIRYNN